MISNKRFFVIFILIFFSSLYLFSANNQTKNFKLIKGSNIYVRIFLFFFPISNNYDLFFSLEKDFSNFEISIDKEDIIKEPLTPSYFESDLIFKIKKIPYNISEEKKFPITIKCNKKFIKKKVNLIIYRKQDILIIKGVINNLTIKEITDNEYFKKRFDWKLPLYFDLRLQIK